jgi:hypothetical protein
MSLHHKKENSKYPLKKELELHHKKGNPKKGKYHGRKYIWFRTGEKHYWKIQYPRSLHDKTVRRRFMFFCLFSIYFCLVEIWFCMGAFTLQPPV